MSCHARLESGDGMQLRLVAEEKPGMPWDVAVSLLGEPVQAGVRGLAHR